MISNSQKEVNMKTFIVIVLLGVATNSFAGWGSDSLQMTAFNGILIDWGQTGKRADIGWISKYKEGSAKGLPEVYHQETNPLLGPYPNRQRVDAYFAAWALSVIAMDEAPEIIKHPFYTILIAIQWWATTGNTNQEDTFFKEHLTFWDEETRPKTQLTLVFKW